VDKRFLSLELTVEDEFSILLRRLVTENMSFISLNILNYRGINELTILLTFLSVISCNNDDSEMDDESGIVMDAVVKVELPKRSGPLPKTTTGVPHIQIGVEPIPEVNEELFRRVYSLPGIENRMSVIATWRGLWINEHVTVFVPEALIDGREFAHIHDDGSLHIFLDPSRAIEAVETCWAIFHPYAVQRQEGWDGFVMLYTPQSFDELDVTFQLIVDGYNYVTAQNLLSTDYY
jgi:phospholipase/carboxylesterase